jgi:hypothetical protein
MEWPGIYPMALIQGAGSLVVSLNIKGFKEAKVTNSLMESWA